MDEQGKWSLSPAYDLTYIFNSGGYFPELTHCLMMKGKLSGHTSAISQFRLFAEKHLVEEPWISAVETRLRELLESWGFDEASKNVVIYHGDHGWTLQK